MSTLSSETAEAVAALLSNIAKDYDPHSDAPFSGQVAVNGSPHTKLSFPGAKTKGNEALEREISALVARVHYLEARAANSTVFPMTPGESAPVPPFPHGSALESPLPVIQTER